MGWPMASAAVAKQALCGGIPVRYDAVEVFGADGVKGRFDDRGESGGNLLFVGEMAEGEWNYGLDQSRTRMTEMIQLMRRHTTKTKRATRPSASNCRSFRRM